MLLKRYLNHLKRFFAASRLLRPMTVANQLRMIYLFREDQLITVPSLEESYRHFHFSPDYTGQWIDLLNSGNDLGYWDVKRFSTVMMDHLHPGTEVLVADGDRLIGACAAFAMKEYEPYAVLAYPVVHPSYRNKGLGTFLIAMTLVYSQLAAYPGMILHTDDFRIPAIRAYLKLGFEPDMKTHSLTRIRWRRVLRNLKESLE